MRLDRNLAILVLALGASASLAGTRPRVIYETQQITVPELRGPDTQDDDMGPNSETHAVAIDGNEMVIVGHHTTPDTIEDRLAAYLYTRTSGGPWTLARKLVEKKYGGPSFEVALKNGVAALDIQPVTIFERATGWAGTELPAFPAAQNLDVTGNGVLLAPDDPEDGSTRYVQKVNGAWKVTGTLPGSFANPYVGGAADLDGSQALVFRGYMNTNVPPQPQFFRRTGPNWAEVATFSAPPGADGWGTAVALSGPLGYVSGNEGTHVFRNGGTSGADDWALSNQKVRPVRGYQNGNAASRIRAAGNLVLQTALSFDNRDRGVVDVYRENADHTFTHVAILQPRTGGLGYQLSVSGRDVVVSARNAVYTFVLPADLDSPAPVSQDFESGSSAWQSLAGSQWSVAQSGVTHVFRQSSLAGDAGAVLGGVDWTDESVQAEVTALEFGGNDRWFGLATRRSDADNYYYVTVRYPNKVVLKRRVDGIYSDLGTVSANIVPNRRYRLRLESIGDMHSVWLDGSRILRVKDTALTHGAPALLMYRTRADFDNVFVSPSTSAYLRAADFESYEDQPRAPDGLGWTFTGSGAWTADPYNEQGDVMVQDSIAGDARATTGVATDDQVVQARVKAYQYAAPSGTQERWFGVIARYVDTRNYYYLSLRSSNQVSLRKVVNGSIVNLRSVSLPINQDQWYRVRLEAIGSRLRAYVDDKLVIETTDSTFAQGTFGMVTYKAAAYFDYLYAEQP